MAKDKFRIKGFCEVLVSKDFVDGMSSLIQTSGLGGLKHNTVLLNWPNSWKESEDLNGCQAFVGKAFVEIISLKSNISS